jgi:CMP-N-acetylneuraminic acid synthetase
MLFDEVYVSSDSAWILDQAEQAGAIPIKRGLELCGDTPNIPVYQHALEHMKNVSGIVAVQANSPTVSINTIGLVKRIMEMGADEVMTCDEHHKIYGSVWAIRLDRLKNYGDPYKPTPSVLVVDNSIDVHTEEDYNLAVSQAQCLK